MLWSNWQFEKAIHESIISYNESCELSIRWYSLDAENEFEFDELEKIQKYIFDNIPDPIMSGNNYSLYDINRKLDQIEKDETK